MIIFACNNSRDKGKKVREQKTSQQHIKNVIHHERLKRNKNREKPARGICR